jgi:hypothetical protein
VPKNQHKALMSPASAPARLRDCRTRFADGRPLL